MRKALELKCKFLRKQTSEQSGEQWNSKQLLSSFFFARSGKLPLPYQNVLHEIQTTHHVAFCLGDHPSAKKKRI
jgi:hypothetical protein